MGKIRVYSNKNLRLESLLRIENEDFHYIKNVMRLKKDEHFILFNANNGEFECNIIELNKKDLKVQILNQLRSPETENLPDTELIFPPIRHQRQDFLIEKATELGADDIYPVYTDNCAVKKSVIDNKIEKWQKIMYEASKQCERAYIPTCFDVTTIQNLYENIQFDYVIAFCERIATQTFREYYNEQKNIFKTNSKILVIIGPEGGFSDKEFEYFKENSIPMLTLGDLILKAETAVITAIGNIIYEYNYSRKN